MYKRQLVHQPAVVLADEPTGNLDSATGDEIVSLLDQVRRDSGAAVVMVTHDERMAAHADDVVRLRDGRIDGAIRSSSGAEPTGRPT